jgi:uncharacterized membrane protein
MRELLAAPFHPIFTHFTIALTAVSLAFDALGRMLDVPSLSAAGWWTVAVAVPLTLGTLASGVTSRVRLPVEEGETRRWLRAHMALGPTFFGGLVAVALWRAALWTDGVRVPWSYLAVMGALVLLMTVQGYLGGELVYRFGTEVRGRYRPLPTEGGRRPRRPQGDARAGTA